MGPSEKLLSSHTRVTRDKILDTVDGDALENEIGSRFVALTRLGLAILEPTLEQLRADPPRHEISDFFKSGDKTIRLSNLYTQILAKTKMDNPDGIPETYTTTYSIELALGNRKLGYQPMSRHDARDFMFDQREYSMVPNSLMKSLLDPEWQPDAVGLIETIRTKNLETNRTLSRTSSAYCVNLTYWQPNLYKLGIDATLPIQADVDFYTMHSHDKSGFIDKYGNLSGKTPEGRLAIAHDFWHWRQLVDEVIRLQTATQTSNILDSSPIV